LLQDVLFLLPLWGVLLAISSSEFLTDDVQWLLPDVQGLQEVLFLVPLWGVLLVVSSS
jgi:hypothetical protein